MSDNNFEAQPEVESPAARKRRELLSEGYVYLKMAAWFLVLFFALRTYVIEGYEVQGPSMEPTLHDGERILVFKLPHQLSKLGPFRAWEAIRAEDIVVFDSVDEDDKRYVKRVVAKGAPKGGRNIVGAAQQDAKPETKVNVDVFEVKDPKGDSHFKVYVNNHPIKQDYLPDAKTWQALPEVHREPDNHTALSAGDYFVMGDNQDVSRDSRSFGPVDEDRLIGKAVLRFWPPSRFGLLR